MDAHMQHLYSLIILNNGKDIVFDTRKLQSTDNNTLDSATFRMMQS